MNILPKTSDEEVTRAAIAYTANRVQQVYIFQVIVSELGLKTAVIQLSSK